MTFNTPFRLDKANARLMGVCAGIANYTGIETVWIRVAFVAGTLFGFGSLALVYLIIGLVADKQPA
ncbi:PspC domain-containing protein [Polymorphobacter fuscus]|uniref:PspC domain-containing protein n=1 Tax=Sandarakinorhabdus fusca TaxID=1439888 RepID=A0A7C9KI98_9SPHN|nr:PspC domain-containing protein [Polymorphobacter fuscus]KAB7647855.1 PspC domain-containing protein [Polymorphobacter fuscus]MQT17161.1 PspC domain-containing protein [Polymorphobacter fuscus]NJC08845.1 phage shock protein C [Polymorphobacter fuscus]